MTLLLARGRDRRLDTAMPTEATDEQVRAAVVVAGWEIESTRQRAAPWTPPDDPLAGYRDEMRKRPGRRPKPKAATTLEEIRAGRLGHPLDR